VRATLRRNLLLEHEQSNARNAVILTTNAGAKSSQQRAKAQSSSKDHET
jgi:hypothetical protein